MNKVIDLEGEVWKVIDGYPDYMISSLGRVVSTKSGEERILKAIKNDTDYLCVTLCKGNGEKPKSFRIHRLLATAFLPNPGGKRCVNHKIEGKDGKSMNFVFFKADGSVDEERTTIEWVTHKENSNYGTCIERMLETKKTSPAHKKQMTELHAKKRKQVYQYDQNYQLINTFPSTREAAMQTGFHNTSISQCCLGKIKTAYNFVWSYTELTSEQISVRFESWNNPKEVFQYTTDGELINVYQSTQEVTRKTCFYGGNISKCCNGKQKTAYGYVWSYVELSSKEVLDLFESAKLGKTVYQYTTDGKLVNTYPSTKEAARQTGYNRCSINFCCNKKPKHKTAHGFIWSYEPLTNTTNQLSLFPLTETKIS